MDFKEVVKNRYSCKKYSDQQVEQEKLDALLAAGRLAPTAKTCRSSTYMWCRARKDWRRSMA